MDTQTDIPAPVTAPPGAVCRRCWHGLKGLDAASVCPECGEPIARSLDADWWGNGPTEPFARLARSVRAFFAGGVAFFLFYCGAMVVDHFKLSSTWPKWVEVCTDTAMVALWFWLVLSLRRAAIAAGESRLTRGWAIKVTGFTAILSCVLLVPLQVYSVVFPVGFDGWWQAIPLAFVATSALMFLSWTVAQHRAAAKLGRQPLRALSWLQFCAAAISSATFIFAVAIEFAHDFFDFRPDWLVMARDSTATVALWAFGLLLLLAALNIDLFRLFVRRFLAARTSAM
ncbi:MAG: hypothetical protein QM783_06485 [Phycisphaerales bacterium]